jgi:hypothetical protein
MLLEQSKKLYLFAALIPLLLSGSSYALDDDEEVFIHGNIEFVILHELAHVIINDLNIPVIGPEEHAADYLATLALIRPDEFNTARADRTRQYASAVAYGFATAWDMDGPIINKLPYWDGHGLTIQRFYNIGCLLFGSNPVLFPRLPAFIGLPERRSSQCKLEYNKADNAVIWLLGNYGKQAGDKETEITISYGDAETVISREILASIRGSNLIENIVSRFKEHFSLARPVTIKTRDCRAKQAYWDSDNRELTLCHELFDYFYALSRSPVTRERREFFKAES